MSSREALWFFKDGVIELLFATASAIRLAFDPISSVLRTSDGPERSISSAAASAGVSIFPSRRASTIALSIFAKSSSLS